MNYMTILRDKIYNPYNRNLLLNSIGDKIAGEEENNAMWSEISDQLMSCKYRQLNYIKSSSSDELQTLSLNIRSLTKHLAEIKDNMNHFDKFDVIQRKPMFH